MQSAFAGAKADTAAWLVLALRPQNPEGISFIHKVNLSNERNAWTVDDTQRVNSAPPPRGTMFPITATVTYTFISRIMEDQNEGHCDVGMVTAAALFPVKAGEEAEITATIPLAAAASETLVADAWNTVHRDHCKLNCPGAALPVPLRCRR